MLKLDGVVMVARKKLQPTTWFTLYRILCFSMDQKLSSISVIIKTTPLHWMLALSYIELPHLHGSGALFQGCRKIVNTSDIPINEYFPNA